MKNENKKMIPCRVCKKMFEPCAYCQEHSDVFRWRNFACSKECAVKYINETTAYRDSLKNKKNISNEKITSVSEGNSIEKVDILKRKTNRKISKASVENEITDRDSVRETE